MGEGRERWLRHLSRPLVLRRAAAHRRNRAKVDHDRREVFADERRAVVPKPCGAVARGEGEAVAPLNADVILTALPLVCDFVQMRLGAAYGLRLAVQPVGCFGELLAALDLNHREFLSVFVFASSG